MSASAIIVKILEVNKHPGADSLDLVEILGWQCVSKIGEFKVGDLAIYLPIDTIVDSRPEVEFLRPRNFRIKTIKLRGEISQGLLLPISLLKTEIFEGKDVSEEIGAKHYEKQLHYSIAGIAKGNFPSFLKKTDEENLRSNMGVLEEFTGKECYICKKINGSSLTAYIKDGEFGVCSRNLDLKEDSNNVFWQAARKYDLENKLRA